MITLKKRMWDSGGESRHRRVKADELNEDADVVENNLKGDEMADQIIIGNQGSMISMSKFWHSWQLRILR